MSIPVFAEKRCCFRQPWPEHLPSIPGRRTPASPSGRGSLRLITLPNAIIAERKYLHGGFRRNLMRDLFFNPRRRAQLEFRIHTSLFDAGFPTLEPVGWAEFPSALPFFSRYFYYTVYDPNAQPLPQVMRHAPRALTWLPQIRDVLLSLFHHQVFHTDLNLNNWLLRGDQILLIDFDRAKPADPMNPLHFAALSLARMTRSADKLNLCTPHWRRGMGWLECELARALGICAEELLQEVTRQHQQALRWKKMRSWISGPPRRMTP